MKHTTKIITLILTIVLSILLFAGCSNNNNSTPAPTGSSDLKPTGELKSVRIGTSGTAESPLLTDSAGIAQKLGYLEEELAKVGYKPEIVGFPQAGPAINEALASKALDVAVYADFPQLVAFGNGIKTRAFASINSQYNYGIIVHGDSGINSVKDLEGKKIIVGIGSILQKYFTNVVDAEGADINKIEIVNASADQQSVFLSKQADGLATSLAACYAYAATTGGKVIAPTTDYPDSASVLQFIGLSNYLDSNPEVPKAIIRALLLAQKYAEANPAEVYKLLSSETIPEALIKKVYGYDESFSYFSPELTETSTARTESTNKFLVDHKLIPEKIDLDAFIDKSYYKAVIKEQE